MAVRRAKRRISRKTIVVTGPGEICSRPKRDKALLIGSEDECGVRLHQHRFASRVIPANLFDCTSMPDSARRNKTCPRPFYAPSPPSPPLLHLSSPPLLLLVLLQNPLVPPTSLPPERTKRKLASLSPPSFSNSSLPRSRRNCQTSGRLSSFFSSPLTIEGTGFRKQFEDSKNDFFFLVQRMIDEQDWSLEASNIYTFFLTALNERAKRQRAACPRAFYTHASSCVALRYSVRSLNNNVVYSQYMGGGQLAWIADVSRRGERER